MTPEQDLQIHHRMSIEFVLQQSATTEGEGRGRRPPEDKLFILYQKLILGREWKKITDEYQARWPYPDDRERSTNSLETKFKRIREERNIPSPREWRTPDQHVQSELDRERLQVLQWCTEYEWAWWNPYIWA